MNRCLFPNSDRCGRSASYLHHGCRGEHCAATRRAYKQQVYRNRVMPDEIDDPYTLISTLVPAGNWIEHAKCRGTDQRVFFPAVGEFATTAKAICATCPVIEPCLDYAVRNGERHGIWGGLTEKERRKLRAEDTAA